MINVQIAFNHTRRFLMIFELIRNQVSVYIASFVDVYQGTGYVWLLTHFPFRDRFLVLEYASHFPAAMKELAGWLFMGKLKVKSSLLFLLRFILGLPKLDRSDKYMYIRNWQKHTDGKCRFMRYAPSVCFGMTSLETSFRQKWNLIWAVQLLQCLIPFHDFHSYFYSWICLLVLCHQPFWICIIQLAFLLVFRWGRQRQRAWRMPAMHSFLSCQEVI